MFAALAQRLVRVQPRAYHSRCRGREKSLLEYCTVIDLRDSQGDRFTQRIVVNARATVQHERNIDALGDRGESS